MITTVKGYDIFDPVILKDNELFIHCCNCQNAMGAGMAAQVADIWPEAQIADDATIAGDHSKLGTFTSAMVYRPEYCLMVANAYGQYYYGKASKHHLDYEALERSLTAIADKYPDVLNILTYPLGCANAGGDLEIVCSILDRVFPDRNVTMVIK